MICERCGKEFKEDWRKDKRTPCRFCSKSCSAGRCSTPEIKQRVSETLKKRYQSMYDDGRVCEKCGKVYHSKDNSRKLCFECLPTTIKRNSTHRVKETVKSIKDVSSRTAEKILKRMELPCACCGLYIKGVHWDIHHIIPRKQGGTNEMNNLCYICPNCHRIAHTNELLLVRPLISLEQQLNECGKSWKDFYYG